MDETTAPEKRRADKCDTNLPRGGRGANGASGAASSMAEAEEPARVSLPPSASSVAIIVRIINQGHQLEQRRRELDTNFTWTKVFESIMSASTPLCAGVHRGMPR